MWCFLKFTSYRLPVFLLSCRRLRKVGLWELGELLYHQLFDNNSLVFAVDFQEVESCREMRDVDGALVVDGFNMQYFLAHEIEKNYLIDCYGVALD